MLGNHCIVTGLLRRPQVNIQVLCPNFLSLPKKCELPKIQGRCSQLVPSPLPPGLYAYVLSNQGKVQIQAF